jgi:hypothetical protein
LVSDEGGASDHTKKEVKEAYPYVPPVLEPKKPEEWRRNPSVPVSDVSPVHKDMPLGAELVPMSTQYTWRRMRDWEQYTYFEFMQWPLSAAIYNIHTHPDSARAFGLPEPNIGVPRYVAFLSLMMLNAFGKGWLRGGKFSYRFVRWVALFDFITAKARLVRKELEGESIRLTFETWIENQRGEKVLEGTSSGLVPR